MVPGHEDRNHFRLLWATAGSAARPVVRHRRLGGAAPHTELSARGAQPCSAHCCQPPAAASLQHASCCRRPPRPTPVRRRPAAPTSTKPQPQSKARLLAGVPSKPKGACYRVLCRAHAPSGSGPRPRPVQSAGPPRGAPRHRPAAARGCAAGAAGRPPAGRPSQVLLRARVGASAAARAGGGRARAERALSGALGGAVPRGAAPSRGGASGRSGQNQGVG